MVRRDKIRSMHAEVGEVSYISVKYAPRLHNYITRCGFLQEIVHDLSSKADLPQMPSEISPWGNGSGIGCCRETILTE